MTSRPANQKNGLAASANQIKAPNHIGESQKRSTNGHSVRAIVNGDANHDDDEDDEEEEELSANQGGPRNKIPPRNNEDAGSFSQSVNSGASSSKMTNHKAEIMHKTRANHSTDLEVSANQKITRTSSGYITPFRPIAQKVM